LNAVLKHSLPFCVVIFAAGVLQLVGVVQDHWQRFSTAGGVAAQGSRARRLQSKLEQLEG
jgi:hypothetical protein